MASVDYALSNNMEKFKHTFDLSALDEPLLKTFGYDLKEQVSIQESGKDILITCYGTQTASFTMTETETQGGKIKKGTHKGTFKCVTKTYRAIVDDDGKVTGYSDSCTTKVTYVKKAITSTTAYQMLDAKGKVVKTSSTTMENTYNTILDKSKVLGTITYKNGDRATYGATIESFDGTTNLMTYNYAPAKKKNTYTGNWQNEYVKSTKANETFSLGAGDNIIEFDMSKKIGKDTVNLSTQGKLTLSVTSGEVNYQRSGNNLIVKGVAATVPTGDDYVLQVYNVYKDSNGYHLSGHSYAWDGSAYTEESDFYGDWETYAEYKEIADSVKNESGGDYSLGSHSLYFNALTNRYLNPSASTGTVTLKNYFKNGVDNVFLNDDALKGILNGTSVVNLGSASAKKKQKLQGTFLDETIRGGKKNDTITTGSGTDTIYLSKGTDTITLNGNGVKTIKYADFNKTTITFGSANSLDLSDVISHLGTLSYVKSGNDLIINNKLTIKGFFGSENIQNNTIFAFEDETPKTLAGTGAAIKQIGKAKKANKNMTDQEYNDVLVGGSKADTFNITKGNTEVISNAGNDTINVKATATGGLKLTQSIGSGTDTLNIVHESNIANVLITSQKPETLVADRISFEKTGNDLIYKTTYLKGKATGLKKNTTDSVVVKNFFSDANIESKVNFLYKYQSEGEIAYDGTLEDALTTVNNARLKINAVYNKSTNTYVYEGSDYNDTFTYSGSNKAIMTDTSDTDDVYNLTINKNSNLTISDADGDDIINLVTSVANLDKNLRLFFDVAVIEDEYVTGSNLAIFNKSTLTVANAKNATNGNLKGAVQINNFIENRDPNSSFTVNASGANINMENWIYLVQTEVENWLNEHEDYESAFDALQNCPDSNAVKDLVACYTNNNYNETLVS